MSASVNCVIIAGHLTRTPETKQIGASTVCNFGIAINRKYKASDGTLKEDAVFIECVAWNKAAEFPSKYLHKGDPVLVEGRLTQDTYEDKDGKKQTKTRVSVERVSSLGVRKEQGEPIANAQKEASKIKAQATVGADDDSEPPF